VTRLRSITLVHGCYPRDFGGYTKVRDLTIVEAAALLGIGADEYDRDLFINKGFILIGVPLPRDYTVDLRDLIVGKRAVYNHDGGYRLIEWQPRPVDAGGRP
jgi:hypothetical protein